MDRELIKDRLHQMIDQFKFYLMLLNKIHPFYDGNDRTCKTLFTNDNMIRQNV